MYTLVLPHLHLLSLDNHCLLQVGLYYLLHHHLVFVAVLLLLPFALFPHLNLLSYFRVYVLQLYPIHSIPVLICQS
ncbi:unnamed protein product [Schistosoma curassoni]|uniref:Ovule protein n=1 Tax=Schistosoma curassoni TaxID=6186 RepID=A0A183K7E9_9TREM|nr:unnamed protein product [Schistosoma curassoni]